MVEYIIKPFWSDDPHDLVRLKDSPREKPEEKEDSEWKSLEKAQEHLTKAIDYIDEANRWLKEFGDEMDRYSAQLGSIWTGLAIDIPILASTMESIKRKLDWS